MTGALPLTALTLVAAVSFVRLFGETSSVVAAVLTAVFTHGWLRASAALRVPPAASGAGLLFGFGLLMAWVVAPHTTAYGIPTAESMQVLGERLSDGFGAIRTSDVPIGPHNGIVLVAAVGVFAGAFASDWVAFRAGAVLSACIPAATLFTLTAALGEDRGQAALTVAFVVAALSFVLAQAPAQASDAHSWFSSENRQLGPAGVLRAGLPIVVVAAALAPVLGPRLPAAESAGLIDVAPGGGGPRTRITVSPLVDIRDRLRQDPPVGVFSVAASQPAYWRMTALEQFDGAIWKSEANYRRADDELPADSSVAPTIAVVQEYQITALAQFWLPAAYRPVTIDLEGARVNPDSLTLLTDRVTADGLAYRVESAVPSYRPGDLRAETGRVPDGVRPLLSLPVDFPGNVTTLASTITAGHRTVYEKSLALQAFFREEFAYSEEVPPGHSGDRLVDFLFTARAGFCEQFSAAFAAMARSVGIPSRVAVGFAPGRLDATGRYQVTSADAHAWPEVYIDPYGWVAFEPTPTRFNPSPANHTGTFNPDALGVPDQPDPAATATTAVPGGEAPTPPATASEAQPAPAGGAGTGRAAWWVRALVILLALAAAGALAVGVVTEVARRRYRRRLAEADPAGAILMAWDDVIGQFGFDGLRLPPHLTPAEAARMGAQHEPDAGEPLEGLRVLVDRAAYSAGEPGRADSAVAWTAARQVVSILEREDPRRRRLVRRISRPR